jgi:hypothetical protein
VAEFSASSVADLPPTTAETLQFGNPQVLGWIQEAIAEGDRINRSDPSYDVIERAQLYLVGEQLGPERLRLKYIPQTIINETRKATQAHVSALTDIKPVFGWKTENEAYKLQANLLNRYAITEWITNMYDIDLGDVVKYSLIAGTGDLVVDWDPHTGMGGAHQLSARDPRDTLAIRPAMTKSPQFWEGVVLREEHSVNALRAMYPTKRDYFRPSTDTALSRVMGRFRTAFAKLITPSDPLDQLAQQAGAHTRTTRSGNVVIYRTYLHDRTRNLTAKPIAMGTPGSAWAYLVPPQGLLYPRGRLIVCTDYHVLYDGPNTYMHGLFPICRLKLWSVPWQFLGVPLLNDILPIQDAINETINDVRLGVRQWMDPDITYNRNAVSETTMRLLDPRRPGKRMKVQPGFGEAYKKEDGPSPQVLQIATDLWEKLTTKFTDMAGTANLSALLQLRQLPSADTIEKYYEALTPEIRQEARQVEAFMRDLSHMILGGYLQFLTPAKREAVLGEGGVLLQDFDQDPGNMVPAISPGQPGYTPELDPALTTRDERAQFAMKLFVFTVAPNSILAIAASEVKMRNFQLYRMGCLDFWTLLESLEVPNVGPPPAIPLPPIVPPPSDPALIAQLIASGKFVINPQTGQLNEVRVPFTIVERLMAMQQLGIGMVENSPGRKSSGQEPPKMEQKSDGAGGQRQTVTESKH